MSKEMLNKVSKQDCMYAIRYLWEEGFVEEMTTNKKYYTTILLKKVANFYNIKLEREDEKERWQDV